MLGWATKQPPPPILYLWPAHGCGLLVRPHPNSGLPPRTVLERPSAAVLTLVDNQHVKRWSDHAVRWWCFDQTSVIPHARRMITRSCNLQHARSLGFWRRPMLGQGSCGWSVCVTCSHPNTRVRCSESHAALQFMQTAVVPCDHQQWPVSFRVSTWQRSRGCPCFCVVQQPSSVMRRGRW